jgi:putative glycosyltransferase (TIGR04372 family)
MGVDVKPFIDSQLRQTQYGGQPVFARKMKRGLQILLKMPLYILSVPAVLVIRLIRPWLLVRWRSMISARIGHFAGNTEMYLCEWDARINMPKQRHVDLCYMSYGRICNQQLAIMWKRVLRIWPSWILGPISRVNRMIPEGAVHEIGSNTQSDRDVHNLLDRFPPHLEFTPEEEARGEAGIRAMGIPQGAHFACLIVRDSDYLGHYFPNGDWVYHNYRDCDIQNFIMAAEELADRGYFVIRMGAKVREAMQTLHPRVIDYATNGMRNDFMDIYLGAKCDFCISTSLGFDAVPTLFRRPIVYVNFAPLAFLVTYRKEVVLITKKHISEERRSLTLREILSHDGGFCRNASDYEYKGVKLVENTPEEIRDVVIEMAERLNGTWQPHEDDEALQRRFWEIFPMDAVDITQGRPLHGEIRARYGASFLRNNREWLK